MSRVYHGSAGHCCARRANGVAAIHTFASVAPGASARPGSARRLDDPDTAPLEPAQPK